MKQKIILALSVGMILGSVVWAADKININTASVEELDGIPGVGPAIAVKIVEARPFSSIEDITRVQGIGEVGSPTFENMKDFITVGDDGGTEGESETTPNDNNDDSVSSSNVSTHSAARELTDLTKKETLQIGAGRDRSVTVNTPVLFEAALSVADSRQRSCVYWSFGDGTGKRGLTAHHTYVAPGTYVAVATAKQSGELSSSRTTVEVFAPTLILSAAAGGIVVDNQSEYEINLGGWRLSASGGEESFVFAPDTIILPKNKLVITTAVSGLPAAADQATLYYPNGQVAAGFNHSEKIAAAQKQLEQLQTQLVSLRAVKKVVPLPDVVSTTTAPLAQVIELAPPPSRLRSWWQKLFQ